MNATFFDEITGCWFGESFKNNSRALPQNEWNEMLQGIGNMID